MTEQEQPPSTSLPEETLRRIRSALMTAWEMGAVDPEASLQVKMDAIEEFMKDICR
jgi:hypothetical protein